MLNKILLPLTNKVVAKDQERIKHFITALVDQVAYRIPEKQLPVSVIAGITNSLYSHYSKKENNSVTAQEFARDLLGAMILFSTTLPDRKIKSEDFSNIVNQFSVLFPVSYSRSFFTPTNCKEYIEKIESDFGNKYQDHATHATDKFLATIHSLGLYNDFLKAHSYDTSQDDFHQETLFLRTFPEPEAYKPLSVKEAFLSLINCGMFKGSHVHEERFRGEIVDWKSDDESFRSVRGGVVFDALPSGSDSNSATNSDSDSDMDALGSGYTSS